METGILHLHIVLGWILFILLIVGIIKNFTKVNNPFTAGDKKLGLFTMIAAHLQLLIGLYQVIAGKFSWMTKPEGTNVMKDNFWRYFLVEHPFAMIISVVLITMANSTAKKSISDYNKHKKIATFLSIALILILAIIVVGINRGIVSVKP